MSQRVLRVATISLWGLLLLARCNLVLANAPTNPCYYHIDAAYDCSMYYQLSNPFCFCPGQQTTRCKPVQQGYMKLHLTMENITHPWMDTAIRTLRLETSKKGRPNAPHHPSSPGSSQRDLDAPISKELGHPSLEGGCQVVRIGKRSPKQQWLRQRKEKAYKNRTKERPRTRVRTSDPLFFWVGPPSHLEDVFSFAFLIKLSCNQAVTLVHRFNFFAVARQN